jgi:Holliday junction resolvase-like predicted endonuclease
MSKLTENEVIEYLCGWLDNDGWKNIKANKDHSRGIDVSANKDGKTLIVEAKGARGNPRSHVTTRKKFDCGQIKTHFGKAIVKILEQRSLNPDAIIAIAQPDDIDIRRCLQDVVSEIKRINIKLFWIKESGEVIEE